MSFPLIKYVLLAAIRDKLIISLFVLLLLGSSIAIFLGSAAVIEKDQFTLIFTAAGLRLISVLSLVLFVVFFVRRSFESKDIEYLLSRPIGRIKIIFSYAAAFSILAIIISIAVSMAVYSVAPHLYSDAHILWMISIGMESIIMVSVALFFAMYISSAATATMSTLGVYVLGRMMGQLLGIIDSPLVDSQGVYAMALQLVSVITPRLDLLGQSSWLLYGVDNEYGLIYAIAQGAVFSFLVLLCASIDFVRRQF